MFNYNHTPYTLPSALDSIIFREQNSHLCVAIVIKCASLNFYVLIFSKSSNLDEDNPPTYLISHISLILMH